MYESVSVCVSPAGCLCKCVISQIDNKLLLKTAVREMCHVSNFDDCFLLVDIGFWLSFDFLLAELKGVVGGRGWYTQWAHGKVMIEL